MAEKRGANIVHGPTAVANFDAYAAEDGEKLSLGKIKIKVLHTTGHTMESSTFLVLDENSKLCSIYSGDRLFIGDVGRPDLIVKSHLTPDHFTLLE